SRGCCCDGRRVAPRLGRPTSRRGILSGVGGRIVDALSGRARFNRSPGPVYWVVAAPAASLQYLTQADRPAGSSPGISPCRRGDRPSFNGAKRMQPTQPQSTSPRSSPAGISRASLMRNSTGLARGAAAASALNFGFPSGVHAAGDGILKVGLVGCGGRGSGAAVNALTGDPNAKMVALGDAFKDKAE